MALRPTPLSAEQVSFFRDEGYLIVPDVFDPAELEPLRREMEDAVDARARKLHAEGRLPRLHARYGFDRRVAAIHRDSPECGEILMRTLEGMRGGGFYGREMFKLIKHPKLLAKLESLTGGPEIVASSVFRVRPKLPKIGRGVVPWHQDSGYFAAHCDEHLIITCWIPLVDATVENGCMRILPRAHRSGIVPHHTGGNAGFLVIKDEDLPDDPGKAVVAECPRGGVVFMTNLTPHCSTPNTSDHIRWSVDLRFQSAEAPNNAGLWPGLEDDFEDEDSDTVQNVRIACYPPEADFIVRSARNPDRVANFADFQRRRKHYDVTSPRISEAATRAGLRRKWTPLVAV
jgi:ectoine hydroxylase-related dioxygenase (phytanoyl-CoA dioxygenase family)